MTLTSSIITAIFPIKKKGCVTVHSVPSNMVSSYNIKREGKSSFPAKTEFSFSFIYIFRKMPVMQILKYIISQEQGTDTPAILSYFQL